jgi:hypothetical protein
MYYNDHAPPHFHVIYSGSEAQIALDTLGVLQGSLPSRAIELVREWAEMHARELSEDWNLARLGLPLKPIAPLE